LHWRNEWKRSRKVKKINGEINKYSDKEYFILKDGADFFETEVMYILPAVQAKMLRETGFTEIQYYNAQSGKLLNSNDTNSAKIDWIYVDCKKT